MVAGKLQRRLAAATLPAHVHLEGEDANVGVVIARIAFLSEGNGYGSRFSAVSAPFQPWLPHSVRHWDRAERW